MRVSQAYLLQVSVSPHTLRTSRCHVELSCIQATSRPHVYATLEGLLPSFRSFASFLVLTLAVDLLLTLVGDHVGPSQ